MPLSYKVIEFLSLSLLLLFTGCGSLKNANNTQKGMAIGTAAGAVLGGILGNNVGNKKNTALGAVLGGIVGGAAGGVIGKKMDNQAREINEALPGAQVERVGEGIKVVLHENTINFDFDSSRLTRMAEQNLDKLSRVFIKNSDTDINVYGYTDNVGADSYNLKLSERRVHSVVDYLVLKGISADRFNAVGMGKNDPIADNQTAQGRSANRRVEFAITANKKMIEQVNKP